MSKKSIFASIFIFIIFILFIISFSYFIRTGTFFNFTFSSLIDYLASAPAVVIDFNFIDLTIYNNWGVLNFVRDFINLNTTIIEVLLTLFKMIYDGLKYLFYLVKLLFV